MKTKKPRSAVRGFSRKCSIQVHERDTVSTPLELVLPDHVRLLAHVHDQVWIKWASCDFTTLNLATSTHAPTYLQVTLPSGERPEPPQVSISMKCAVQASSTDVCVTSVRQHTEGVFSRRRDGARNQTKWTAFRRRAASLAPSGSVATMECT